MNETLLLVPTEVFTETDRVDFVALAAMTKVALSVIRALPMAVTDATVTPSPETWTMGFQAKLVPLSVTITVVPAAPTEGLMPESVGDVPRPDVPLTVKVTAPLVPPDVDTVTL